MKRESPIPEPGSGSIQSDVDGHVQVPETGYLPGRVVNK